MKFDQDNMVILDSLTKRESCDFITFLEAEILRHWDAIRDAEKHALRIPNEAEFWGAAIRRHREDIISAQERINQVIIKFGLVEKFKGIME